MPSCIQCTHYIVESLSEEPEEDQGTIAMKAALGGRISQTGLKCDRCGAWICEACRTDRHEGCGGTFCKKPKDPS